MTENIQPAANRRRKNFSQIDQQCFLTLFVVAKHNFYYIALGYSFATHRQNKLNEKYSGFEKEPAFAHRELQFFVVMSSGTEFSRHTLTYSANRPIMLV